MITALHAIRFVTFAVFLALGIRVARARDERRRAAVKLFLGWMLLLSAISGFTQTDNWPFSPYTLAAFRAQIDKPVCLTVFAGVAPGGREFEIDPLAWSPVYSSILQYWFEQNFDALPPSEQANVLRFLGDKAEESRRRLLHRERLGYQRLLGGAAATYWWLLPRKTTVSPARFVAFRVYRSCVVPEKMLLDGRMPSRDLIVEARR